MHTFYQCVLLYVKYCREELQQKDEQLIENNIEVVQKKDKKIASLKEKLSKKVHLFLS